MIDQMDGFHAELPTRTIDIDNGRVLIPTAPGLGVELNEDEARANPYDGDKLHLEMGQTLFDPARNKDLPGAPSSAAHASDEDYIVAPKPQF